MFLVLGLELMTYLPGRCRVAELHTQSSTWHLGSLWLVQRKKTVELQGCKRPRTTSGRETGRSYWVGEETQQVTCGNSEKAGPVLGPQVAG